MEQLFQELSSRYELFGNLKPGFNPKAGHVAFTLEPVPYIHRPLFIYIAAGVFEFVSSCFLLRARGFQSSYIRNLRYWIRHGGTEQYLVNCMYACIVLNVSVCRSGGGRSYFIHARNHPGLGNVHALRRSSRRQQDSHPNRFGRHQARVSHVSHANSKLILC